jgi:hypothetical protein
MQIKIGETKSSKKLAKLARKYYRRDVRDTAIALGKTLGNAMKPKPRWVPMRVWLWAAGFFIKIKK